MQSALYEVQAHGVTVELTHNPKLALDAYEKSTCTPHFKRLLCIAKNGTKVPLNPTVVKPVAS